MYLVTGLCKTYKMYISITFSLSPFLQVINNTLSCFILSILFIKTIHSHSQFSWFNNPFSLSLIQQSILTLNSLDSTIRFWSYKQSIPFISWHLPLITISKTLLMKRVRSIFWSLIRWSIWEFVQYFWWSNRRKEDKKKKSFYRKKPWRRSSPIMEWLF